MSKKIDIMFDSISDNNEVIKKATKAKGRSKAYAIQQPKEENTTDEVAKELEIEEAMELSDDQLDEIINSNSERLATQKAERAEREKISDRLNYVGTAVLLSLTLLTIIAPPAGIAGLLVAGSIIAVGGGITVANANFQQSQSERKVKIGQLEDRIYVAKAARKFKEDIRQGKIEGREAEVRAEVKQNLAAIAEIRAKKRRWRKLKMVAALVGEAVIVAGFIISSAVVGLVRAAKIAIVAATSAVRVGLAAIYAKVSKKQYNNRKEENSIKERLDISSGMSQRQAAELKEIRDSKAKKKAIMGAIGAGINIISEAIGTGSEALIKSGRDTAIAAKVVIATGVTAIQSGYEALQEKVSRDARAKKLAVEISSKEAVVKPESSHKEDNINNKTEVNSKNNKQIEPKPATINIEPFKKELISIRSTVKNSINKPKPTSKANKTKKSIKPKKHKPSSAAKKSSKTTKKASIRKPAKPSGYVR